MDFDKIIHEFRLVPYMPADNTDEVYKVNGHIHTPYSFSAFNSIPEAIEMASNENIKILGINDFYTADGYGEFYNSCITSKIYPLFNIEFIGLIKGFQEKGIRVNDPNNPGRTYFSGKGLKYPFYMDPKPRQIVRRLQDESNTQVRQMVNKANVYFSTNDIDMKLDFDEIKNRYAKELVRERHIAKAIRIEISEKYPDLERKKEFLKVLYGGKETKVDITDNSALENEIRGNLLKSGGAAFVPEDENAFLSIEEIIEIIIDAGGIPCYPVLLDDSKGNFTDFEGDWDNMHRVLSGFGIKCIELIPGRNSLEQLEKFVNHFNKRGYVILLGTEHNTPDLIPMTVTCRNKAPLTENLLKIGYEGACVIAAHQFLNSKGREGYVNKEGKIRDNQKKEFVNFGKAVIKKFLFN